MFLSEPVIDLLLRGILLTALAMFWIIVLVRVNGLRSYSKMTNFDFVMTIAIGSLVAGASQATNWAAFVQAVLAMMALFIVQYSTARMRKTSEAFESLIQNKPVVLMRDGKILDDALTQNRVAKSDLIAKLREANVLEFSEVRAVILETTGDISVLHGAECSESLLHGTK